MSKLDELKELREKLNITVVGENNYPYDEPCVIVSNHNCLMDIFYLPSVINEDLVSMVSARLAYKKGDRLEVINKYLNAFPCEAHGGRIYSNLGLENASKILQEGISINIFPEGAYIPDNTIVNRGRTGASRILFNARDNGVKANLVPIAINIKSEIKDLDNYNPNSDEVEIVISEPVNYEKEYELYKSTTNPEFHNELYHNVVDYAMIYAATSIDKKYIHEYIELTPKGNVMFANGETVNTDEAQNRSYINQYEAELRERKNMLIKSLKYNKGK